MYNDPTPAAARDRLIGLAMFGYLVPWFAIEALHAEALL